MRMHGFEPQGYEARFAAENVESGFVTKVFGWMAGGLLITAIVALLTTINQDLQRWVFQSGAGIVLIIAQLGMVLVLSWAIQRIPPAVATIMFLLYSALTGVTISFIFLIYTAASIQSAFFACAGMFGVTAAYGYFTKRDLTTVGSLAMMGLFGFLIASVINLFLASSALYWLLTYAGIAIFVGLTAYDTQKIRMIGAQQMSDDDSQRAAIMGALALYLDFINLFLLLLRLLGRRR
jgi:hypothetical protein